MYGDKSLRKRFGVLGCSFAILCMVFNPVLAGTYVSQRESAKIEMRQKNEDLKRELQKSHKEIREEAGKKDALDNQITLVQQQIDNSNRYIITLEQENDEIQGQISEIHEEMKKKIEQLKSTLRSIYVAGDTSTLDIVLGSKDFNDFLDKADIVRSVSDTIKRLIAELEQDLDDIKVREKEIQINKDSLEESKRELESNQAGLQALFDESEANLSQLEKSEQEVKREMEENEAEIRRIESQIKQYQEEQKRKAAEAAAAQAAARAATSKKGSSSTVAPHAVAHAPVVGSGRMVWPVPGFTKVTSDFYDTINRNRSHGAMDIAGAGVYGASVVAADSGTVIFVNSVVDERGQGGGGYGKYIIIDHGNGQSTVYGHLSAVSVYVGQAVQKGQKIGCVGNTGFSTGPHLHFEYRVEGVRHNPREVL